MKLFKKVEYINRPLQVFRRLFWVFLPKKKLITTTLPWGIPLLINPQQAIGKSIYTLGVYDLILSETINRVVQEGDIVLDIGANIGYFTNLLAFKVKNTGKVFSFEPHPKIIDSFLKKNIETLHSLGYSNIAFFPIGLSDTSGIGILNVPNDFINNEGLASFEPQENILEKFKIQLQRLDDIIPMNTNIKLLKIDVEGHELSVFKGSLRLLSTNMIENIIYEDHIGIHSPTSTFLLSFGYEIFKLNRTFNGVFLNNPNDITSDLKYDVTNYFATKNISSLSKLFALKGWSLYSEKYNPIKI